MKKVEQYKLVEVGEALQKIRDLPGKPTVLQIFTPIVEARRPINALLNGEPFELGICRPAAVKLDNALHDIYRHHFQDGTGKFQFPDDPNEEAHWWSVHEVRSALAEFDAIFRAELEATTVYAMEQHGIYSIPMLADDADRVVPTELKPCLNEKAIGDLKACGRCLAFGLPTASGFHAARAVEAVLEDYYRHLAGGTGTLRSWDDYKKALDKALATGKTPCPSQRVINAIGQMKDDFRNPVAHPRIVLTEADALVLFGLAQSAIIGMLQEMKPAIEAAKAKIPIAAPATLLSMGAPPATT